MWEEKTLFNVCELAYGKSLAQSKRVDGDFPVYGSAGKIGNHHQYLIQGPGIIIGRKGNVGSVYYEKEHFFPIDTVFYAIAKQCIDIRFLYYKLKTLNLSNLNTDSAVPGLNRSVAYEQTSKYPPLSIQRKVAGILSPYDDLIENNLKRIKLLEKVAFIEYQLIANERQTQSFTKYKVEDILLPIKRKIKIQTSEFLRKGAFPIIDQSGKYVSGYTNEIEAVYTVPLPMIVFGDHTRILKYITFPFACGADGTQLIYPNYPNISTAYLYFELISLNLSNYHYARHFKYLKEQDIYLPKGEVMLEYKTITDPLFELIYNLRLQNNKLNEARDILLPRLMNGEIEV